MVGETLKARLARKRAEIEDIARQKKPPALPRKNKSEARYITTLWDVDLSTGPRTP